ncbi:hypoxanthine phosphoribosyltransferase [Lujinxingia vulgaris]|uniref:Hypoxanthine phosphoribosyltransferase n=1 Tax=Lujinxingia vulgaris TaxID=2600176 RepID=A0A5C6XK14_9DELT|nr:hypoxanthine phosphoribosyltransferase [Lujinxingia vulgaris]TXD37646.1 hypoxanthine phosphoribosyltransferase [Lujinxingia vulgaris]
MKAPKRKLKVLISEEEIQKRCRELAAQINEDFAGDSVHVIGVLKGSFMFLSDLVKHLTVDVSIDFLGLSSYGTSQETSGVVRMTSDLALPIKERNVIIVEDIIDTGLTMKYLVENLRTRMPSDLKVCTLLSKPSNTREDVPLDYVGFTIGDEFVIGYGLDDAEFSRNIPYIGVVDFDSQD